MKREHCVVCKGTKFIAIYKQEQFPVCISSSSQNLEEDIFDTIEYIGCTNCGCVQLKTLTNPQVLYSVTHNNTYETPTWKQHHLLFSEFVLRNTSKQDFVEIGGASGYFAELLAMKRQLTSMTIIDLAEKPSFKLSIRYIQANCEEYDFRQIDSSVPIVLSHVFEHLYQPRKFLEKLKEANTQTVCMSVPNLEICLKKKFLSFLHV